MTSTIEIDDAHVLNGANLSRAGIQQLRAEHAAAVVVASKRTLEALGRLPTEEEFGKLCAAIVGWFNDTRIPQIEAETQH